MIRVVSFRKAALAGAAGALAWEAALRPFALAGFLLAGVIYGALFRRAASDRDGGWLFGLAYGFLLWIAAPVAVMPLIRGAGLAAGVAGVGFLVSFLVWGLVLGGLFPFVHRPFRARLDGRSGGRLDRLGPDAAVSDALSKFRGR